MECDFTVHKGTALRYVFKSNEVELFNPIQINKSNKAKEVSQHMSERGQQD